MEISTLPNLETAEACAIGGVRNSESTKRGASGSGFKENQPHEGLDSERDGSKALIGGSSPCHSGRRALKLFSEETSHLIPLCTSVCARVHTGVASKVPHVPQTDSSGPQEQGHPPWSQS